MPSGASASTTAFQKALIEPVVPDSPMPFAPRGLRGVRRHRVRGAERRELGRRRHRVVDKGGGERVAVVVVAHLLEQHLRDALRETAVHLAGGEQRVDHGAAVVDGDEIPDARRVRSRDRPRRRRRGSRTGTCRSVRSRARAPAGSAARVRRRRARPSVRPVAGTPATPSATVVEHDDVVDAPPRADQPRASAPAAAPPPTPRSTAEPASCNEREPNVPVPWSTRPVSECTTRTDSNGTPSVALAICAHIVSCPCPCGTLPDVTTIAPVVFHGDRAELRAVAR